MARFTDRSQVSDALGIPFSDQQLDAITAPLEPGVIIAGAGSGRAKPRMVVSILSASTTLS